MSLAHEGLGAPPGARTVWYLHGVFGHGRNWRSFARRGVLRAPESRAVLVDLPHHGASAEDHANTLAACAPHLDRLAADIGPPDIVVGHSLGGKVALMWAEQGLSSGTEIWALDSPPGARDPALPSEPQRLFHPLRTAPAPASDRGVLGAHLRRAGVSEPVVAWLLTSTRRGPDGWRWVWDLDGVEALLHDALASDLWSTVDALGARCHLIRAAKSGLWSAGELARAEEAQRSGVHWDSLEHAGHWLHVDDPEGILALLEDSLLR